MRLDNQGYTLIELILVITLITALVAYAIPNFIGFNKKATLTDEAVKVTDTLRQAQSQARSGVQDNASKVSRYRFELLPVPGDPAGYYRGFHFVKVDDANIQVSNSIEQHTFACDVCASSNVQQYDFDLPSGNPLTLGGTAQSVRVCSPGIGYYDVTIDSAGKVGRSDFQNSTCSCASTCGSIAIPSITPSATPSPTATPSITATPTDTPTPTPSPTITPTITPSPTPIGGPTSTPTPTPTPAWVSNGLQVRYTFEEGVGSVVYDVSGSGQPLNLSITEPSKVSWQSGSLSIDQSTLVRTTGSADKIIQAVKSSGEITVEAWVRPANVIQDGPARIITLSENTSERNFTLGQSDDKYDFRLRADSATYPNGTPSLSTPSGTLDTSLTHVVYTRDNSDFARIYINGVQQASKTVTGSMSNWADDYALGLANEISSGRTWLGSFHMVSIYNVALDAAAVANNYSEGAGDTVAPTPTPNSTVFQEQGGSIVMEAENYTDRFDGTGSGIAHSWNSTTAYGGYQGSSAMQALPNSGDNMGLLLDGPELQYDIDFQTTGDYYVYVRGYAPNPSSTSNDTVHAGLNGTAVTLNGVGLTGFNDSSFTWQNSSNGQPTKVNVPSVGQHTFSLWMREDGFVVDRIWLSNVADVIGNGDGSAGPPAGGGGNPVTSTVRIRAMSSICNADYARMRLQINGNTIDTWTTTGTMQDYTTTVDYQIQSSDEVRVRFLDDCYVSQEEDRNLRVDYIDLNGVIYQSEALNTWVNDCWNGFLATEWLYCDDAYFEYAN